MSSENTVRSFEFAGADAGPWVTASSSMRVQSSVGVTVHAVTLIGQTPVDLGTVSAGSSGEFSTTHAFVRLVSAGAGAASIAASMPVSTGSGGGGTADTTEATQLLVKAAVEDVNTKTPALEDGRVPVTVQSGLASEVTSAATLAKLASIDGKTPTLVQKQVVDEASATVTYVGEAPLGTATSAAAWLIRRVTTAGTVTTIEYSPANSIFNNRASLGYT